MQFKKSAVVGVLITLYLSTDSWCLYIPEKKTTTTTTAPTKKNKTSSQSEKIQICGNTLTTLIIEACDGIVESFNQENGSKDSVQTKITEDCCDQECSLDYLQNYCKETPLFTIKKTLLGKLISKLTSRPATESPTEKARKKEVSEVREKKHGKRGKSKKKKRSFKRKCAYESFGHFLLKLDRGDGAAKEQNNINRTWPSIQIGTISPEMDKFGGQPIVVLKKNKSNSV